MTLGELKKKVLGMIEEYNPLSDLLTDDPDIATKINDVINQILFELARFKKIPKYIEMEVSEGDIVTFEDIERECGYEVYQINVICGVRYVPKAEGTALKMLESGKAEIDVFVYPERITAKTKDNTELELTNDVLELAPYGIAGDLLKSDISAEYGNIYATRYQAMINALDYRYQMPTYTIEGGVSI